MRLLTFSTDPRILAGAAPLQEMYAEHFESYVVYVGSLHQKLPTKRDTTKRVKAKVFRIATVFSFEFWKDVYHADVISVQDPFETGWVGLVCATIFRKPLYVQVHTDIFSRHFAKAHPLNRLRQRCAPFVLRRATRVRVVSERIRNTVAERGVHVPISVLPIYVDVESLAQLPSVQHEKYRYAFLYIGRLEKEKNVIEAVRAVAYARAKGYDAGLTIVGDGSEREAIERAARDIGIEKFVAMVGEQEDIKPFLSTAGALLLPSLYEGYGLVIIEALAARVPVIAYDVGVAREAGAIIAPENAFQETVLAWIAQGAKRSTLQGYPYQDRSAYVHTWVRDVRMCL